MEKQIVKVKVPPALYLLTECRSKSGCIDLPVGRALQQVLLTMPSRPGTHHPSGWVNPESGLTS